MWGVGQTGLGDKDLLRESGEGKNGGKVTSKGSRADLYTAEG